MAPVRRIPSPPSPDRRRVHGRALRRAEGRRRRRARRGGAARLSNPHRPLTAASLRTARPQDLVDATWGLPEEAEDDGAAGPRPAAAELTWACWRRVGTRARGRGRAPRSMSSRGTVATAVRRGPANGAPMVLGMTSDSHRHPTWVMYPHASAVAPDRSSQAHHGVIRGCDRVPPLTSTCRCPFRCHLPMVIGRPLRTALELPPTRYVVTAEPIISRLASRPPATGGVPPVRPPLPVACEISTLDGHPAQDQRGQNLVLGRCSRRRPKRLCRKEFLAVDGSVGGLCAELPRLWTSWSDRWIVLWTVTLRRVLLARRHLLRSAGSSGATCSRLGAGA